MKNLHLTIWLMVIASTFFWGSNFNAGHAIAGDMTALSAAAERFSIAVMFFWLLRFGFGKKESNLSLKDFRILILLGITGVFGFNYAFFTALHTTSSLNAALMMALSPMLSLLFSVWMLNTTIKKHQYIGIAAAFLGVLMVITGGNFKELQIVLGDAWMFLACVVWSLYSVGSKKFASHIPSLQFARWTVSIGALALIIATLLLEDPLTSIQHAHTSSHWILVYMAIFGTVLAYIFWLKGVYFLGPEKSAIAFNLVPVFTLVVNLLLGQLPNFVQILGMALVFLGVLISSGWTPKNKYFHFRS